MIDSINPIVGIPVVLILWAIVIVLIARDRRRR